MEQSCGMGWRLRRGAAACAGATALVAAGGPAFADATLAPVSTPVGTVAVDGADADGGARVSVTFTGAGPIGGSTPVTVTLDPGRPAIVVRPHHAQPSAPPAASAPASAAAPVAAPVAAPAIGGAGGQQPVVVGGLLPLVIGGDAAAPAAPSPT